MGVLVIDIFNVMEPGHRDHEVEFLPKIGMHPGIPWYCNSCDMLGEIGISQMREALNSGRVSTF